MWGASPSQPVRDGSSNRALLLQRGDVIPRVAVFQQHFLGVFAELGAGVADACGRGAELDRRTHHFDVFARPFSTCKAFPIEAPFSDQAG